MPLSEDTLRQVVDQFGTPVFVYDAAGMMVSAGRLHSAFSWASRFRNFFAIKALPRLPVLQCLRKCGSGVECCSVAELVLAERAGFRGSEVIYTCIYPLPSEVEMARALGAMVNLDYVANLGLLLRSYRPDTIFLRLNPGDQIGGSQLLGVPCFSKFGSTEEQLIEGFKSATAAGVQHLGLHGMFASNILDLGYFQQAIDIIFSLVQRLEDDFGLVVDHIDMGGGVGIPYSPQDSAVDVYELSSLVRSKCDTVLGRCDGSSLDLSMECGRYIVGPHGALVTRALQVKRTYKTFVFVDASATNYPRPGIFGGYNALTVLGKHSIPTTTCDVVGLLCDNYDRFCVDRILPEICEGDLVVVENAGAHAAAMSYDYNGRLRCNEVLVAPDGTCSLMRREQSVEEYLGA